jgi:hypothetical protein
MFRLVSRLVILSAMLCLGLWMLHEARQEFEFFALYPTVPPFISASIAAGALAYGVFGAWRTAGQPRWLTCSLSIPWFLAAGGLLLLSAANGLTSWHAAQLEPASVRVQVNSAQRKIQIDGTVDRHLPFRLASALPAVGACHVSITSLGGDLAAARRLGETLLLRGCVVRVERFCASACVVVWSTAEHRELAEGGLIGLHGFSLDLRGGGTSLATKMEDESIGRLLDAGFDSARLYAAISTSDVTWLRADELEDWGVRFRRT